MCPLTRRRALHGAVALLAGVAGCSGEQSSSSSYPSDPIGNVAFDPASHSLRNPTREPTVWTGERPTPEDEGETHLYLSDHLFVADADSASDVSFADIEGVDGARSFLDATDYDAETVYIEQTAVQECFTNDLCYVEWSETEVQTSYARQYRDADVACETGVENTVATLIRIPAALDPERIDGYGSSRGSASCERRNEHLRQRMAAANRSGKQ